jgi:hypothetical protein
MLALYNNMIFLFSAMKLNYGIIFTMPNSALTKITILKYQVL